RGKDSFAAYNFDYQAGLDTLTAHLPAPAEGGTPTLAKKVVLLLGTGGVGRALAHALHKQGAILSIANRTAERAEKLAVELGCRHIKWEMRHNILCDLLVNCTSVGMHPHVDESPIHPSYLKPGLMVFDTVYAPETTLLVREA